MRFHRRRAFTLVELLVVMAIIAIMVAVTLPAINAMRDAARRTQCMANVSRLITAVHNYEMAYEVYPTGVENDSGPIVNEPQGFHHGWMQALLPYLDEQAVAAQIDREVGVYAEQNKKVRAITIPTFVCPSAPDDQQFPGLSCYAGVQHDVEAPIDKDNHGLFFLNRRLRYEDVTDGTAHTLFLGEKYVGTDRDLGWMSGTRATLRNTGNPISMTDKIWPRPTVVPSDDEPAADSVSPAAGEVDDRETVDARETVDKRLVVGGFGSHHAGGAVFAFGDGKVEFVSVSIGQTVYQQMGNRADGGPISR